MSATTALQIDWLGGNCPVQAEGTVAGEPFYFRARGHSWSMSVGGEDVVGNPAWAYGEDYGSGFDAGWMSEGEARAFIAAAAEKYLSREDGQTDDDGQPDEAQEWHDYDPDC